MLEFLFAVIVAMLIVLVILVAPIPSFVDKVCGIAAALSGIVALAYAAATIKSLVENDSDARSVKGVLSITLLILLGFSCIGVGILYCIL
jgi:hypothetical protein